MKQPSKAQLEVLMQMAKPGVFLHTINGMNSHAFLSAKLKTISIATVRVLETAGYLEDTMAEEYKWKGSKFILSQKGKDTIHEIIRADYACKVCGSMPDQEGWLTHGSGCYQYSPVGGGLEYIQEADIR